jgi:hypothetical protein
MATTYSLISSVTVGSGGAANIEFTSIPATYTDLLLKTSLRTDRALEVDGVLLSLNNSTSNFTVRRLLGDGFTATSDTGTRALPIASAATATSNTFNNSEIYFPNYTSANYKSYSGDGVAENNATFARADLTAGLWSDTSVITSIKLTPSNGLNFVQYSTAYLYGISNA